MLSTSVLILFAVAVAGLLGERLYAVNSMRRALREQHESLLAEAARFRADYSRDFLALREDHARALAKLEASVDGRLEAFIAELLDVSQSVSADSQKKPDGGQQ